MEKKVLDKLKWHPKKSLNDVQITYIHRGAPGNVATIKGRDIIHLEKSFFVIMKGGSKTRIPYHRIKRIEKKGDVLYEKRYP